jgi:hypothetical protein
MRELRDWYELYSHKLTHAIRLEAACAACGRRILLLLARTPGLLRVNCSSQVGRQKASVTRSIYHLPTPSEVSKRFWAETNRSRLTGPAGSDAILICESADAPCYRSVTTARQNFDKRGCTCQEEDRLKELHFQARHSIKNGWRCWIRCAKLLRRWVEFKTCSQGKEKANVKLL